MTDETEAERQTDREIRQRDMTGMVQLVQRPTEKPGAILPRVRVPGAARDCSARVNFRCRICTAPVCINSVCMLKIQNTGSQRNVRTDENTAHTDRSG